MLDLRNYDLISNFAFFRFVFPKNNLAICGMLTQRQIAKQTTLILVFNNIMRTPLALLIDSPYVFADNA